jgi:hypothetical protein
MTHSPHPLNILDSIMGFVDASPKSSAQKPNKIGVIDPSYSGGSDGPKITFEGESTMSAKQYPYVDSYTPKAGDRVVLCPVGTGYLIVGSLTKHSVPKIDIETITNFNNTTKPGWYYAGQFSTGSPGIGGGDYFLLVLEKNGYVTQKTFSSSGGSKEYIRNSYDDGWIWTNWVVNSDERQPYTYYEEANLDNFNVASSWQPFTWSTVGTQHLFGDFASCFDAYDAKFTAPCDGVYQIGASAFLNRASAVGRFIMQMSLDSHHNNNGATRSENAAGSGSSTLNKYPGITMFTSRYLDSGRRVFFDLYASGGVVGTAITGEQLNVHLLDTPVANDQA